MIEHLDMVLMGPKVWTVEMIHPLVELESSSVIGAGPDVWAVEVAAESGPGALRVIMAVAGCLFGTGPAAGV